MLKQCPECLCMKHVDDDKQICARCYMKAESEEDGTAFIKRQMKLDSDSEGENMTKKTKLVDKTKLVEPKVIEKQFAEKHKTLSFQEQNIDKPLRDIEKGVIPKTTEFVDERGVYKLLHTDKDGYEVSMVTVNPYYMRGDHYHKQTEEIFTVVEGTLLLTLFNIHTNDIICEKLEKGDSKIIPANTNHSVFNYSNIPAKMLIHRNTIYSKENTDTYVMKNAKP